jgi:hypothetical protein
MSSIAIKNYPKPILHVPYTFFGVVNSFLHVTQLVFCGLGEDKRGCAATLIALAEE